MAILTEAGNKTWDRVKTDPFYKEMLDEVKAAAQKFEKTPVEALKFSEFNLFYQTGNRMVYETAYFERRGRLNAYALLYLVYREQKYLSLLENVIWAICDDFTWALPAHVPAEASVYQQARWIDLFASETGFALSEIYHLIGNDLAPFSYTHLDVYKRQGMPRPTLRVVRVVAKGSVTRCKSAGSMPVPLSSIRMRSVSADSLSEISIFTSVAFARCV